MRTTAILAATVLFVTPSIAIAGKKKKEASQPNVSEITVTKRTDSSSPMMKTNQPLSTHSSSSLLRGNNQNNQKGGRY